MSDSPDNRRVRPRIQIAINPCSSCRYYSGDRFTSCELYERKLVIKIKQSGNELMRDNSCIANGMPKKRVRLRVIK